MFLDSDFLFQECSDYDVETEIETLKSTTSDNNVMLQSLVISNFQIANKLENLKELEEEQIQTLTNGWKFIQ